MNSTLDNLVYVFSSIKLYFNFVGYKQFLKIYKNKESCSISNVKTGFLLKKCSNFLYYVIL